MKSAVSIKLNWLKFHLNLTFNIISVTTALIIDTLGKMILLEGYYVAIRCAILIIYSSSSLLINNRSLCFLIFLAQVFRITQIISKHWLAKNYSYTVKFIPFSVSSFLLIIIKLLLTWKSCCPKTELSWIVSNTWVDQQRRSQWKPASNRSKHWRDNNNQMRHWYLEQELDVLLTAWTINIFQFNMNINCS